MQQSTNKLSTRKLIMEITLDKGVFVANQNTKVITELAIEATITKVGGKTKDNATIKVYGMNEDDIATLTTLNFKPNEIRKNHVVLRGGYDDDIGIVFAGDITKAWGDYSDINTCFTMECITGYYHSVKLTNHTNVKGLFDAATLFKQLAAEAGLQFKNNGINIKLSNPILEGAPIEQIQTLAKQLGIHANIDGDLLIIASYGEPLHIGTILLTPESGLISYPKIDENGVIAEMFFDPSLRYGELIEIKSKAPKTSGFWKVYSMIHTLQNRGDTWKTEIKGSYYAGSK